MNLATLIAGWEAIVSAIQSQGIDRLEAYVSQKSISSGVPRPVPEDIWDMVRAVQSDLAEFAKVEVVETGSYPVITATIPASQNADKAPWLLLYNMGDTRPIGDEKEWLVPPLSCQTVEVEGQKRIVGRGVFNSKSGLAGMIDVIQLLVEQKRLPVNLEVLIDFEEEVRVDSSREVITTQRERYAKCRAALMPMCVEKFNGIWLGYKGVAVVRVTLKQHRSEVHSGMESVLTPPLLRRALDQLLSAIEDQNRDQLAIATLRGGVTDKDRELATLLAGKMDLQAVANRKGVKVSELRSQDVAQAILDESRSHINVLSWGSEHREGTVPTKAYAELEFRISPSVTLTAEQIEDEIRRYVQSLAAQLPEGVTMESVELVAGTGEPYQAMVFNDPVVATLQASYAAFEAEMPLVPSLFGSVPEGAAIVRTLSIPFMAGGLGVGDRAHVPNEYILEGAYERFKQWLVVFLHQFAQQ